MTDSGSTLPTLELRLLGPFRVLVDGVQLDTSEWQRRKMRLLLKILALQPQRQLHREQIQEALWPSLDLKSAANNLYKTIYLVRHALEPALGSGAESRFIVTKGQQILLQAPGGLRIDVVDFERLAAAALRSDDIAGYQDALSVYGGDLLTEDLYEDWLTDRREQLRQLHQELLSKIVRLHRSRSEYGPSIERLKELLVSDPSNEAAHRELMWLYAVTGARHQALRQYRLCEEVLRREVDANPDEKTNELYREIVDGKIQPLLPSESTRVHSLTIEPPATRLIGRQRELNTILACLRQAQQGEGATILIGGEPGVGKTRLALEALELASREGFQVQAGGCYEQEGPLPYGPFVEALARCASSMDKAKIDSLAGDYALTLSQLVPTIASRLALSGEAANAPPRDRHWLFAAIVNFFARLGKDAPVVLFLDDLHAADEDSLSLLHHLARKVPSFPMVIIGCLREEEVGVSSPLPGLMAALYREGLSVRIGLQRFTQAASDELVSELVGGEADPPLLDHIFELAAGNPFFTCEVVRAIREQGLIDRREGLWVGTLVKEGPHPAGLADWVRVRLERLTEEARGLMNVASVIGLESAFEVLLDVGSFDESRLIDITEQLLLAHFLEPTRAGFRFHHGIVREIVYSRISPARRAQLHRKVARSIERIYAACLDDHVEALAHHNTLGDRVDEAIHYLTLAGDRALSIYSNELAIKHYTSALELVPGRDRAVASRLLERLGDVRSVTGSVAIAVHTYISAIETGGEGTDDAARRHRKAAYQLILQSRLDEAERHLAAARKDLDESSNQVELARLHYTVSHLHWHRLEFEPAKNAAEASLRAAEKADSQPDKMLAYEALALTHLPMGDWKRGMEYESRRQSLCDLNQDIAAISDVHL